jgi:AraC-like DNA-binding protein/quercetin dioxygenase-like cupin family protein
MKPVTQDCGRIGRLQLSGFTVSEFLLTSRYRSTPHRHEKPGLVLPLGGALTLAGSFGARTIHPGEMLSLPAGVAHSEHTAGAAACLLLEPAASEQSHVLDRVRIARHPGLLEATRRLSISLRCASESSWKPEYEALELLAFADSASDRGPAGKAKSASWVRRAAERLREEYYRPPSLANLAEEAGVSREHLSREFRHRMGLTIGGYLRRQQVLAAVRLLQESGLSISQVALATGFTDQSHLCRRLRRCLGATPGMIRAAVGTFSRATAITVLPTPRVFT